MLAIFTLQAYGQKIPSQKPRLVVGITISGMRYDYLSVYWDKFGEEGIKRLVMSGTFCKNASYDYLINQTAVGHATIATGALPSHHGIISNNWYNSLQDEIVYCVADDKTRTVGGNFESGQFSPRQMLASTIGDEIRLSSNFRSKVIGIALDNSAAILSAGHSANYSFWYDNLSGHWITSSYYTDSLPDWVKEFNDKNLAESYLDRTWETLLPLEEYKESDSDTSEFETGIEGRSVFPYDLEKISRPKRRQRNFRILKYTPYGNVFTRDFATAAVINEEMGQDEYTDYLAIGFTANEYIGKFFGSSSVEMQDAMLRLDLELAHFMNFIDDQVGVDKYPVHPDF